MPNRRYEAGVRFEKRVAEHFRSEGYHCVESRGSHGIVDVVAVKPNQTLLVQCKTDGKLSPADWNGLYGLCRLGGGMVPILAERVGRKLVFWELFGPRVKFDRQPPKRPFYTDQTGQAA